jgi:glutamine synthetase
MSPQDLHDLLERDGIARLWVIYHDYSGVSHAKSVPRERFPSVVHTGVVFAKANMDFNILDEQVPHPVFTAETGDFFAVPDGNSYAKVPYHPATARTYSFMCLAGREPWDGCPRTALQNQAERLLQRGLHLRAAFEPECYLFVKSETGFQTADRSRMFSVDGLERHEELLSELVEVLTAMDVTVEQVGAEYGPAQYEINTRHAPAIAAADDLLTVKEVLRALARRAGLVASFMPKPFTDLPGCGLHVHLGLDHMDGSNALEGDRELGLSALALHFIGGLLAHAPALTGVGSPTVNSYQRLLPGSWSPAHVAYGAGNRAALVRIPDGGRIHIEFRSGDNTSNPYMFLAATLAAGLDGVERQLDPGPPVTEDVGHVADAEAKARGLRYLPRTASEALDAVESDDVIMHALGPTIGPTFLRVKRSEIETYRLQVSEWERSTYLETI